MRLVSRTVGCKDHQPQWLHLLAVPLETYEPSYIQYPLLHQCHEHLSASGLQVCQAQM